MKFFSLCVYLSAHYATFSEFVRMERWLAAFYQVIIIFILEGGFI